MTPCLSCLQFGITHAQRVGHRCVDVEACEFCGGQRSLVTLAHLRRHVWLVGREACRTCSRQLHEIESAA